MAPCPRGAGDTGRSLPAWCQSPGARCALQRPREGQPGSVHTQTQDWAGARGEAARGPAPSDTPRPVSLAVLSGCCDKVPQTQGHVYQRSGDWGASRGPSWVFPGSKPGASQLLPPREAILEATTSCCALSAELGFLWLWDTGPAGWKPKAVPSLWRPAPPPARRPLLHGRRSDGGPVSNLSGHAGPTR